MSDEAHKVTEQQQKAPDDLHSSEIRYRRLFESARDGILILDAASRKITDVNPFMVEFLGYSRDEFLGKELWEIGLFRDKGESQKAFQELQEKGYIRYEDMPLQTKLGKRWEVEFISNVYQEDGHSVIQCNVRDITERKSIEERLKQSEQWLRTIFEASHEGILVEDNERIHYVNKSYLQLFGYDDPEELIGQHISVVVSQEDTERLLKYGRSRLRGEQSPSEYEFKGQRKDGTPIDVEASVSASHVADSNYITTMIRDITERKRAEAALKKINEELEDRVAERTSELTKMNTNLQAEVSKRQRIERERSLLLRRIVFAQEDERRRIAREMHDQFGQQLTVLKMKLDAVTEEFRENENLSEQIKALRAIAHQLDEDVDNMVWGIRPTALDDLGLQEALSSYVQNWSKHFGIPVQLHASGMDMERFSPEIETTLYRIAQEALNNIVKHSQARHVAFMLDRRAAQVSLMIEDDGVGFNAEQVFEANDTGLGLIGMRERATLVGGTIKIESQPGEGATVIVQIPVRATTRSGEIDE